MRPWSVQQLFNRLDPTNPALNVVGSDHPNTSKNQSRSNRGTKGCHITSRDVTFNVEILHHEPDIFSAQFERDQPPEYALTEINHLGIHSPYIFWTLFQYFLENLKSLTI
jgi:hypothetical protein